MDVVVGKSGSFFVVKNGVKEDIIRTLAGISFEEFAKYNAYSTMKKLSKLNSEEYAVQHGLRQEILDNFSVYDAAVDFRITQDLMYFISSEDGRERFLGYVVINPDNYKNGFVLAAPREVSGVITDSFQIADSDIPEIMKKVGIEIKRQQLTHFVKWNDITYRVDVTPAVRVNYDGAFDNKSLTIVEHCYIFESDDWRKIKKIEHKLEQEVKQRKNSWFLKEKPENEILENIIRKMFGDKKAEHAKFTRMFDTYQIIKKIRHDYRGTMVHEFHHLRNKILLENRRLKPSSKSLRAEDMYAVLVEDERSSALAATIDRINTYWLTNNFENLIEKEPCFKVLAEKSPEQRNALLKNMEFVVNARLQWWTLKQAEAYQKRFIANLPELEAQNSFAKGEDLDGSEFRMQQNIMYSLRVYNPDRKKYEFRRLDKHIKIPIPITPQIQEHIIDKAQYYIDRKKSSMSFLIAKYGLNKEMFWKAAKFFDSHRRLKKVSGKTN